MAEQSEISKRKLTYKCPTIFTKMNKELFREIQSELDQRADKEYREHIGVYFKMDVSNYLGIRLPLVRKIADKYFKELKGTPIEDVLEFCNTLLETKIYEYKVIAFHWSYKSKKTV